MTGCWPRRPRGRRTRPGVTSLDGPLLDDLVKAVLGRALEAEPTAHLGLKRRRWEAPTARDQAFGLGHDAQECNLRALG